MSYKHNHALGVAILSCWLVTAGACTPAGPTAVAPRARVAPPSSSAVGDGSAAVAVPRILAAVPASGVIDLGPVLVPLSGRATVEPSLVLADAARRLGADAFVLERTSLSDTYRIRTTRVEALRGRWGQPVYEEVTVVYQRPMRGGEPLGGDLQSEVGFYRALRYSDKPLPGCAVDWAQLLPGLEEAIDPQAHLAEQLRVLSVLLAQKAISGPTYRAARLACLGAAAARE